MAWFIRLKTIFTFSIKHFCYIKWPLSFIPNLQPFFTDIFFHPKNSNKRSHNKHKVAFSEIFTSLFNCVSWTLTTLTTSLLLNKLIWLPLELQIWRLCWNHQLNFGSKDICFLPRLRNQSKKIRLMVIYKFILVCLPFKS